MSNIATKSVNDLDLFLKLVDSHRIPRFEPFDGLQYGPFTVLGPSVEFYEERLASTDYQSIQAAILTKSIEEEEGDLDDNNQTSSINSTSTVIQVIDGNRRYLFTGDAGVQALDDARRRNDFSDIFWLDVPHHGARANLSHAIVEYLSPTYAFISAAGTTKHPHRTVINALKSAGATVYSTQDGRNIWYHSGTGIPNRPGYTDANPL